MTRRADLRGHVRGSESDTPVGVPLSGGMHGEVSSRETCSRKLSSAVPWRTPSKITIPSRWNASRRDSASIVSDGRFGAGAGAGAGRNARAERTRTEQTLWAETGDPRVNFLIVIIMRFLLTATPVRTRTSVPNGNSNFLSSSRTPGKVRSEPARRGSRRRAPHHGVLLPRNRG